MKKTSLLLLLLILGVNLPATAQRGKQKKADKLYEDLAYTEAAGLYKELIDKEYNTVYNKQRLGDTYIMLRNPYDAVVYYEDVVKDKNASAEYYYKYAQALRGVKRYDDSRKWLEKYLEAGESSRTAESMLESDDYKAASTYLVTKADFNSEFSDFGVFEENGKIYFVSARTNGTGDKEKMYSWNGEPYLDIYQLDTETNEASALPGDVNTKLHDGPGVISRDGRTMYFTRNNFNNNKEGKRDKKATNHLKIYSAELIDEIWTNVKELPFSSDNYSVGNPSLSPDGRFLYFTSDMPGGIGGTDLYKVEILQNGFGSPENLGEKINTKQDENFAFVNRENVLYFSSNGHPGLGLMDIFSIDIDNPEANPENAGEPLNSNMDDFAYFNSLEDDTGYIASNRDGGSDDIFRFRELGTLTLKGKITDKINNDPIARATVKIFDEENNEIAFLETDEEGNYSTEIGRNKNYPIEAKQIKYETRKESINTFETEDKEELVLNLQLDPVQNVEYLAEIENIYFDFDKYGIRQDAAIELDKLVELMESEYPELVIEIGSHTDLRGSEEYNERLAVKRAKSTYDYLVSKGIDKNRIITYKGYGEKNPAVECDSCDEQEHQLNRRSMFKVVSME